jgi:hypothetical protein
MDFVNEKELIGENPIFKNNKDKDLSLCRLLEEISEMKVWHSFSIPSFLLILAEF